MTHRDLATRIAWTHMGQPYLWGGDDPMEGFDCSGLCIEILKSVGKLPREGDWTADGLLRHFSARIVGEPQEGCLAFWINEAGRATHVEYCIDRHHSIGASGGGSATTSVEAASKMNAYIKVRPIASRGGRVVYVDPFLGSPYEN